MSAEPIPRIRPETEHERRAARGQEFLTRSIKGSDEPVPDEPLEAEGKPVEPIDTSAPLRVARAFIKERAGDIGVPDLVYWQGEFWQSRGTHYEAMPGDSLKATLYSWLEKQTQIVAIPSKEPKDGSPGTAARTVKVAVKPNKRMVESTTDALKAAAHIDVKDAPAWLVADPRNPADIIACSNGLLHVPTRELSQPTRTFFTLNAVKFSYLPEIDEPHGWIAFLRSLWGDDIQSIETLQEIFGLALTGDTKYQKCFLLVGPRRSGKGTIARIITDLIGAGNTTAPTLSSLGQQFGKQSLIGKTLALIADARIGHRADLSAIVETLLSITGEDSVNVPRKFMPDWSARLSTRFVILSNELPAFIDQSAALPGRFIVLRLTESFYGREDLALYEKLRSELPGILLWALVGLDRLRNRGHFVQPESAVEMVQQLETLSSPIKSFVADKCILSPAAEVERDKIFQVYQEWARTQGKDHPGSFELFSRNLTSAYPSIKRTKPRLAGNRRGKIYQGIRLRTIEDPEGD